MPLIRKNQKPTFARFFSQEKILELKLLDFFAKRIALRLARNFLNSFRCFTDKPVICLFSQKVLILLSEKYARLFHLHLPTIRVYYTYD